MNRGVWALRRFVLKREEIKQPFIGTVKTTDLLSAETRLGDLKPKTTRTGVGLRSGEIKQIAIMRKEVSPEEVKKLLEEAKKRIEEAQKKIDKVVKTSKPKAPQSLEAIWKKKILKKLSMLDPSGYKCYQYPWICTLSIDRPPVSEDIIKAIQDKAKQLFGTVGQIRNLASSITAKSREENPALQLSAFYNALFMVINNFYRTNPSKIINYLNKSIPDAKRSLRVLKEAINKGAQEWSKEYCSKEGCITASKPIKINGQCVKYEMVALQLPKWYEKWYISKFGRQPDPLFASIVPTYTKEC